MLKAALIGFGGIAQAAHVPGYQSLEKKEKVQLVAACDINEKQFCKKMDINISSGIDNSELTIHQYTSLEEMLEKEDLDIIDVCLPTPFHAKTVVDMLNRGYNVISEKPMARTSADCRKMLQAAETSKGKLMIAQCLRFFSEYDYLKTIIDSNEFGKPLSAVFCRMSAPPVWSWENWYMDETKSGSCLLDMHIHDVDMIRYLFGEPQSVSCVTQNVYSGADIVHSRFFYPHMPVTAIGDWSEAGTSFTAAYRVGFEKATVVLEQGIVTVYPREGEKYNPVLSNVNGYEGEIEFFTDVIRGKTENIKNSPESAAKTIKLIETLKQSADKQGETVVFKPVL